MNCVTKGIPLFIVALFTMTTRCQKSVLKNFYTQEPWFWAGDSQRRGKSAEEITPPLQLLWTYKAHSALGKAIAAADSFITFGTNDGWVTILNINTGKAVRNMKIQQKVSVTSLFYQDCLIVAKRLGNPSICAIRTENKKTVWKSNLGPISSEPLLIDQRLICANESGELFVLNSQTGENRWKKHIGDTIAGYSVKTPDTLIVATIGGTLWSVSLNDGKTRWKQKLDGSIAATPVIENRKLFIGTQKGTFYSSLLVDGSLVWQYKGEGSIYKTAAADQMHVYFGTTQGVVYCLNAETGIEKWRFETESVVGTSPLISGQWIYFGSLDKILYCISKKTGEEKWQYEAKGRIKSSPIAWKGILVFASEDRFVYGLKEKK